MKMLSSKGDLQQRKGKSRASEEIGMRGTSASENEPKLREEEAIGEKQRKTEKKIEERAYQSKHARQSITRYENSNACEKDGKDTYRERDTRRKRRIKHETTRWKYNEERGSSPDFPSTWVPAHADSGNPLPSRALSYIRL